MFSQKTAALRVQRQCRNFSQITVSTFVCLLTKNSPLKKATDLGFGFLLSKVSLQCFLSWIGVYERNSPEQVRIHISKCMIQVIPTGGPAKHFGINSCCTSKGRHTPDRLSLKDAFHSRLAASVTILDAEEHTADLHSTRGPQGTSEERPKSKGARGDDLEE